MARWLLIQHKKYCFNKTSLNIGRKNNDTVNDSSAFVFNQTLDNMKVIGKWQDNPDQLFRLGTTVFNGSHVVAIKVAKRGPLGTVPE